LESKWVSAHQISSKLDDPRLIYTYKVETFFNMVSVCHIGLLWRHHIAARDLLYVLNIVLHFQLDISWCSYDLYLDFIFQQYWLEIA